MTQITISPIDGSEVVRKTYTSPATIQQILSNAQQAQALWKTVPVAQRAQMVSAGVDAFVAQKSEIALELTKQMGRPIRYTPSEVGGFEARARHMIQIAEDSLKDVLPHQPIEKFTRFIRRSPVGVVLVIAPWNYPLLTAVNAIVPALMAGNAVVLKHSAQTPLAGDRIVETLSAHLPTNLLQVVYTDHAQTQKMIQAPEVNFVCFTGSVAGGVAVEQAAAGRFIGVGLELGGNDPGYVHADADLDYAVDSLVDGAFFNSGQSCCGIQRIYVHQSLYQGFVEKAVALTNTYVLGNPLEQNVTLGPVVRKKAADEIRAVIQEATSKGAKALIDRSRFSMDDGNGAYVAPQILVNVDHSMLVMNEECFGPVCGIMPVSGDEEALRLMNDSKYGLSAAIYTKDESKALELGDQIQTGTVFMNRCDYLDPALAWTGVKNTGRGATLSSLGYEHLTQPKSFHLKNI